VVPATPATPATAGISATSVTSTTLAENYGVEGKPALDPTGARSQSDAPPLSQSPPPGFQNTVVCSFSALIGLAEAVMHWNTGATGVAWLAEHLAAFQGRFRVYDDTRGMELETLARKLAQHAGT